MTETPLEDLPTGVVFEDWTGDARFYEYTKAANPIGPRQTPAIPIRTFAAALHQSAETQIVPLDLASELGIDEGPATTRRFRATMFSAERAQRELDAHGAIIDPTRVDWEPGRAFVTPPGMWHAHVNESGAPAHLFPIQDAGLQTYLRSLDIRFSGPRR